MIPSFKWIAWLVILFCTIIFTIYILTIIGHIGADFDIVRHDALLFQESPLLLYRREVTDSMVGFLYPPPSILLFVPLSLLPERVGYLLMVTLITIAMAAALILWFRVVRRAAGFHKLTGWADRWADWAALFALGLTARPMYEAAVAGQIDPIVLLLCVAYLTCMYGGRPGWGGALLALGCWIKIYPALLLVHALRNADRWRCLSGFVVIAVLIPLAALPLVPATLYVRYFTQTLPALSGHAITNIYNQSAAAFLARLDVPFQESMTSYQAHPVSAAARVSTIVAALCGIAVMASRARRQSDDDLLLAASIMAVIGPVAPLGWGHTYVYVMPLVCLTGITALIAHAWDYLAAAIGVLAILAIPPHHRFAGLAFLPQIAQDVIYSRYLLATLFLLIVSWRLRSVRDRYLTFGPD